LVVPDWHERSVLSCGPAGYGASLHAILAEVAFDLTHFHTESFTFDEGVETPTTANDTDARRFTIQFARSGKSIFCDATTTVLAATREAGLRLPFSCAKGVCGTCKTKILSGEVEMKHGGGIRPKEVAQGLALLCCSRPLSDLVIDR
jgi:ferredoxin